MAREFIFGDNTLGTVTNGAVIGGEDPDFDSGIIPGIGEIFYGSGTTMSSFAYPIATIASWSKFIATATSTAVTQTFTKL